MHRKKCDICGFEYEANSCLEEEVINGPLQCPHCEKVIELQKVITSYSDRHMDEVTASEVYKKNFYPKNSYFNSSYECSTFRLDDYDLDYEVENRTKTIKDLIKRLQYIREYLITRVGAQFEILDSIYEKKNTFWMESGNFLNFCHDASFQYVIIKLKELVAGSRSKYSIQKIKNIVQNKSTEIYKNQKIYEVRIYKNSKDVQKSKYPEFPFSEYLKKIDDMLDEYSDLIKAIAVLRDKAFAHIDGEDIESFYKKINYIGLKRIYNASRMIYDGFLYSIAPDLYHPLTMDYNMWFDHMDDIVHLYQKQRKK